MAPMLVGGTLITRGDGSGRDGYKMRGHTTKSVCISGGFCFKAYLPLRFYIMRPFQSHAVDEFEPLWDVVDLRFGSVHRRDG